MTLFETPVLFEGYELDLAIILPDNEVYPADLLVWELLGKNKELLDTDTSVINYEDEGVYRFNISDIPYTNETQYINVWIENPQGRLSEIKQIRIERKVCREGVYLKWLNYLGGWDSWLFTGFQDFGVEIAESQEIERDIYNIWDNRFTSGTTQNDYVRIDSRETKVVRSGYLSQSEIDAIRWIRQSIKVQELNKTAVCNEKTRRTVLVDKAGGVWRTNQRKLREISFNIRYTNKDNIQTQ
jgi:hypothetical protein